MQSTEALTRDIANFVVTTPEGCASPPLSEVIERALIDTLGVAIASRNEQCVRILQATVAPAGLGGQSTVWVTGELASEANAALVNGTAVHALDFDDVTDAIYGHPSAALLPALVAVAEREQVRGAELFDAYLIGFQVACAVADGLPIRPHYSRGWHSTATVGTLAATAGVARLLHLDENAARRALAIAASMASGSRQNFGTMTKPLHAGLTGHNAVMATRLAANGFSADPDQLESKLGYFAMFGVDSDLTAVPKALHGEWALAERGLNVKKYPCCYNTHRSADAAIRLAPSVSALGVPVDAIELTLEPGGLDPLIHHRPTNGLTGKFSAEYVVSACLNDGSLSLRSFEDTSVRRPEIVAMEEKMTVGESDRPPFGDAAWDFSYAALEVRAGGQTLRQRVDVPSGDARNPLSRADLERKFRDCIETSGSGWDPERILEDIASVRHGEVGGICRTIRGDRSR